MLTRLHRDHVSYFGMDAPWWSCLAARIVGPMPMLWDAREWPAMSPEFVSAPPGSGGMTSGEARPPCPLGDAVVTRHHLVVRGPTIEAEIAHVETLVNEWQRRRDEWHARMEAKVDLTLLVRSVNGTPVKKGVYAFRGGPMSRTPGIRQLRDTSSIDEDTSGILAVGTVDRSHFALVEGTTWTLIGCTGGDGKPGIEVLKIHEFDDIPR